MEAARLFLQPLSGAGFAVDERQAAKYGQHEQHRVLGGGDGVTARQPGDGDAALGASVAVDPVGPGAEFLDQPKARGGGQKLGPNRGGKREDDLGAGDRRRLVGEFAAFGVGGHPIAGQRARDGGVDIGVEQVEEGDLGLGHIRCFPVVSDILDGGGNGPGSRPFGRHYTGGLYLCPRRPMILSLRSRGWKPLISPWREGHHDPCRWKAPPGARSGAPLPTPEKGRGFDIGQGTAPGPLVDFRPIAPFGPHVLRGEKR